MLYILSGSALILLFYIFYLIWKRRIVRTIFRTSAKSLVNISKVRSLTKDSILIIAIILFCIVLLKPQWGDKTREVNNEGTDVLIALDVSNSMLASDIEPNRLSRAKKAIQLIAESLRGDRIGLIIFAGDAFLLCPLTTDIGAFMMFLESATPKSIAMQGTDIGKALKVGYRIFKKKRLTTKMFLIVTDGEDHQGTINKAVKDFAAIDVSIYAVGIGKSKGDYIPMHKDENSSDSYYRDEKGKFIRTKKNEKILKNLSNSTKGKYIDITSSFSGISGIIRGIRDQQKNKYGSRVVKEKKEQFHLFAIILIILLMSELLIPERGKFRATE